MKVLINADLGGWHISKVACEWLEKNKMFDILEMLEKYSNCDGDVQRRIRTDIDLVECFEILGSKTFSGFLSKIRLIGIPFDSMDGWHIEEYDGREWIAEDHRIWNGEEE